MGQVLCQQTGFKFGFSSSLECKRRKEKVTPAEEQSLCHPLSCTSDVICTVGTAEDTAQEAGGIHDVSYRFHVKTPRRMTGLFPDPPAATCKGPGA